MRTLKHRLTNLERSIGTVLTTEPPFPQMDPIDHFRWGVVRFDGPGRVRYTAAFDPIGDIACCVRWCNWYLKCHQRVWVLISESETEQALVELASGWLKVSETWRPGDAGWPVWSRCGGLVRGNLAVAAGCAVRAWLDQGMTTELTTAGVTELLRFWQSIESDGSNE
jgi:hypothetical protein